ncbi:hypothetical protein BpHYR1_029008 [Brachionus plicatilis]|uniref:Uncharacterized protein n=1 Tax=Brachionus plicatilis TaxID=10195 RepID=A0A3M7SWI3_BRAPC|nr:hypothetical protein BpHYR1_029008 [Brachionus plicatilis]
MSKFKIDSVNAEWCNIQSCINCKNLLIMCEISEKCPTLDYIEIYFLRNPLLYTKNKGSACRHLCQNQHLSVHKTFHNMIYRTLLPRCYHNNSLNSAFSYMPSMKSTSCGKICWQRPLFQLHRLPSGIGHIYLPHQIEVPNQPAFHA